MKDPNEGLTPEGFIRTGVRRDRVSPVFESVIEAAIREVERIEHELHLDQVSLYLYGSVATGTAVPPLSDVDLLTVNLPLETTEQMARTLSSRFTEICRGVEVANAGYRDFQGETDECYGGRVFVRHYCLHLYGCEIFPAKDSFRGDVQAARGFNGDIAIHYGLWCAQATELAPRQLGRFIARKSLLAAASLVSIHDQGWTTDRRTGAVRWAELNPQWRPWIDKLLAWSDGSEVASREGISEILLPNGVICSIVNDFQAHIGLWP